LNEPLVTICVPTYNAEAFIAETIQSILKQSYKHFELFVLDNCSTDKTGEICRRIKDPRVTYICNERNLGSLGNFNKAITTGRGEYLAIYHADDVYEKGIVAQEVAVLLRHPDVNCVYTRCSIIDEHSRPMGYDDIPAILLDRPLTFQEVFTYILGTLRSPFITPSCMVRRIAYKAAGRYSARKYPMAGDVEMHLKLTRTSRTYILDKRLLRYRHSPAQASIIYSTTYETPNQLFGLLDSFLSRHRKEIPERTLNTYEAYREWDYTVCAINLLAKKRVSSSDARRAGAYLRRSLTWRRFRRIHKELLLSMITICMLVLAHLGLARPLARAINKTRWERHLAQKKGA